MSGDAHTPGKWEARRATKPDNAGGYDWAIIAPGKAIIAECFEVVDWREEGVTYDVRPVEANARLIAAAPELLAACIWAEAAIAPFSKDPAEKSGISMLRAAIAKAQP